MILSRLNLPHFNLRQVRMVSLIAGICFGVFVGALSQSRADCFKLPYNCPSWGDINAGPRNNYEDLYIGYAAFAWQDFLALNWPAAIENNVPKPHPDYTKGLDYNDGEYVAVWQAYTEARDLFLPDGGTPQEFGQPPRIPAICENLETDGVHLLLDRTTKAGAVHGKPEARDGDSPEDIFDEYIQALRMGPVVDQNGRLVRFGINFNQVMHDYVVENGLYNKAGQELFSFLHPDGPDWPRGSANGSVGSIFVKSAWKVLGEGDNPSKFFRSKAYIYNAAGGAFGDEPLSQEQCAVETVGLVGFHIVHRTNSAPQWVWSTFEHAGNAPWLHDFSINAPLSKHYSFFDPSSCPAVNGLPSCKYNMPPDHPWSPDTPGEYSGREPTQIVRVAPPGLLAKVQNENYPDDLADFYGDGVVWRNYFLVDVQFPTIVNWDEDNQIATVNPAYPDGVPSPSFLANSTLETYIQGFGPGETTSNGYPVPSDDLMDPQGMSMWMSRPEDPFDSEKGPYNKSGGTQRITSSCISCHSDASMTNGVSANFVFALSRAKAPSADAATASDAE